MKYYVDNWMEINYRYFVTNECKKTFDEINTL